MKWIYTVILSVTYCGETTVFSPGEQRDEGETNAANTEKHKMDRLQNGKYREREKENGFSVYKQINTSITQGLL